VPQKRTLVLLAGAAAVLVLAALVDLPGIAKLPFYTKGEPREALVVWEMAHDGGLVLPRRNGDEIPSKPPLFHWLGLVAARALGEVNELATRLPSAALAIAMTGLVYAFGATAGRLRSGWLAALALTLSFEWLRAARTARVDMTFSFFVAAALLVYAVIDRSGATKLRRLAFFACLALAALSKGPVGIVLPLAVVVVHALVQPVGGETTSRFALAARGRRLRAMLAELGAVRGLVTVLAVVGLWYAAAWASGGSAFLEMHAFRENVFRVLDADRFDSGHSHGFFYLFGQFFLGAFPWSLLAPAVPWWLWHQRPLDGTRRLLVVWFAVIFVFFLIPESKRGVYLLPAYPAGALLFGLVLGPGPEEPHIRRVAAAGWFAGCAVLVLAGLVVLLVASGIPFDGFLLPRLRPAEAAETALAFTALRDSALLTAAVAAVVIGGAAASAREGAGAHWLRASVPLAVSLVALLGGIVAPLERVIAGARTFAPFLAEVRERIGDEPLAFHDGTFDYGAVYYADRHVPRDAASIASARYLLAFESKDGSVPAGLGKVLLRSEGTGPKGRTRLLLAAPSAGRGAGD
jgi:4-amino-4-deoxy-L-arabinose transferase-like glycosyltransferase